MVSKKRTASRRKKPDVEETEPEDENDRCCDSDWQEERAGAILGGTIMIAIGGIFLANTMGWLPWSFWETISRLWPLILIIVGVWLIAKYLLMR